MKCILHKNIKKTVLIEFTLEKSFVLSAEHKNRLGNEFKDTNDDDGLSPRRPGGELRSLHRTYLHNNTWKFVSTFFG